MPYYPSEAEKPVSGLPPCRVCRSPVSSDAFICPKCGAPHPANPRWDGYGFEYKSGFKVFGLPLLHISFKYRNRRPVPARGIIAIGQFGVGVINISQFGIGVFSLHQFGIGALVVGQFAAAVSGIAQIGVFMTQGMGQRVINLF